MPERRACNRCAREFDLTPEFWHRDPKGKLGLCQTCKLCAKERAAKWHADNRERANASSRASGRLRTPEARRAEYERNREQIIKYQRRYYGQNGEKVRLREREYKAANKADVAERRRRAYFANREAELERTRAWQAANPEIAKASRQKVRARRRAAPGRLTPADVHAQYSVQRGACFYCHHSIAYGRFEIDHYIPLSRGGTNEPENIVLACHDCNRAKGSKLPHEFQPPKD